MLRPEKGSRVFFVVQTRRARASLLLLRVQCVLRSYLARPEAFGGEEDGESGVRAMRAGSWNSGGGRECGYRPVVEQSLRVVCASTSVARSGCSSDGERRQTLAGNRVGRR